MLKSRAAMHLIWFVATCSAGSPVQNFKCTDLSTETVCQLYASRLTHEKKQARVHATAWVALRHGGSWLQDPSCPKVAIGFRFADDARNRPMVKNLNEAMVGDVMDLRPRIFDVRMTGIFSGQPWMSPAAYLLGMMLKGLNSANDSSHMFRIDALDAVDGHLL